MNAADDPSPNSRLITRFDEESILALDEDGVYAGEIGLWTVHRYGGKSYVLLSNQRDHPAIEVNSAEMVIYALKGNRLLANQFKNLMDVWKPELE